jgi:hypothetical protein
MNRTAGWARPSAGREQAEEYTAARSPKDTASGGTPATTAEKPSRDVLRRRSSVLSPRSRALATNSARSPEHNDNLANCLSDSTRAHDRYQHGDEKRHRGFNAEYLMMGDRESQPPRSDGPCQQYPGYADPCRCSLLRMHNAARFVALRGIRGHHSAPKAEARESH